MQRVDLYTQTSRFLYTTHGTCVTRKLICSEQLDCRTLQPNITNPIEATRASLRVKSLGSKKSNKTNIMLGSTDRCGDSGKQTRHGINDFKPIENVFWLAWTLISGPCKGKLIHTGQQ